MRHGTLAPREHGRRQICAPGREGGHRRRARRRPGAGMRRPPSRARAGRRRRARSACPVAHAFRPPVPSVGPGGSSTPVRGPIAAPWRARPAADVNSTRSCAARSACSPVLDGHAGAPQRLGHGPGAGADDGGAAQRREPAEPLPLQHHVRPDAVGDGVGELRRGGLDAREGERAADRGCAPCAGGRASRGGSRSVPITATGTTGAPLSSASRPTPRFGRAERAGPRARALGEHHHRVAAGEDRLRGLDHRRRRRRRGATGKAPSEFSIHAISGWMSNSSRLAT